MVLTIDIRTSGVLLLFILAVAIELLHVRQALLLSLQRDDDRVGDDAFGELQNVFVIRCREKQQLAVLVEILLNFLDRKREKFDKFRCLLTTKNTGHSGNSPKR